MTLIRDRAGRVRQPIFVALVIIARTTTACIGLPEVIRGRKALRQNQAV